jgi:hypothetical protein
LGNLNEFLSQVKPNEVVYIYDTDTDSLDGRMGATETPLYTNGAKSVKRIENADTKEVLWSRIKLASDSINVARDKRIRDMVESWNNEGRAWSHLSNDDAAFFDMIGVTYGEIGTTSQTGNDLVYYNTELYDSDTDALRGRKKTLFAKGGMIFTDERDNTVYTLGKSTKGKWTVFSENEGNWKKRDEFPDGLANQEDAILVAKSMAGLISEFEDGGTASHGKVMSLEEFKANPIDELHDVKAGDDGVVWKLRWNPYGSSARYFKHGRKNSESISIQEGYNHYKYFAEKGQKYSSGGEIEVVGKANKGAFRNRDYKGMSEKDVEQWWIERGFKPSKTKTESSLKPYTFYINKFEDGGEVKKDMSEYTDLSKINASKINTNEVDSYGHKDKLILSVNGNKIADFYYNMRGYNQNFDLLNAEGTHCGFGGDRSASQQVSAFKKALKEGFVYLKPYKFAKGGNVRANKQYNKEVDLYNWFVVDLKDKKALTGFEYRGDATDALADYDNTEFRYKVVALKTLASLGIEDPRESWKHKFAKGGKIGTQLNFFK